MMVPTAATRRLRYETRSMFDAVRAEALFVSALQSSDAPSPERVRRDVAFTIHRYGIRGCAARLASEFGDHPDSAAARMRWALATINAVYAPPPAPLKSRVGRLSVG